MRAIIPHPVRELKRGVVVSNEMWHDIFKTMSYYRLLVPFGVPYALYVCVPALFPESAFAPWIGQAVRIVAVAAALLFYRKSYALLFAGAKNTPLPRIFGNSVMALITVPIALCAWNFALVATEHLFPGLKGNIPPSDETRYFLLHMASSVLLAPVVEEFLFRGHIQAWMRQAQKTARRENCGFLKGVHLAFDEEARDLDVAATSWACAIPAGILFTLGHAPVEYPAAIAYFAVTAILFKLTRSITACIFVHAVVNFFVCTAPSIVFIASNLR